MVEFALAPVAVVALCAATARILLSGALKSGSARLRGVATSRVLQRRLDPRVYIAKMCFRCDIVTECAWSSL